MGWWGRCRRYIFRRWGERSRGFARIDPGEFSVFGQVPGQEFVEIFGWFPAILCTGVEVSQQELMRIDVVFQERLEEGKEGNGEDTTPYRA